MARLGVVDAAHHGVRCRTDRAVLVAPDAGPDLSSPVLRELSRQVRVGYQRPGHLAGVRLPGRYGGGALGGVYEAAAGEDRDPAQPLAHPGAERQEVSRRTVETGPGLLDCVYGARHHADIVDALAEREGVLGAVLGLDSGPWRQLVAAEPEPHHAPLAHRPTHGRDDFASEAQAPFQAPSVAVLPLVREARKELAYERVLAGVHLHAVESSRHRM